MKENRELSQREKEKVREYTSSRTGAENRQHEKPEEGQDGEDTLDQHRAEMNGKKGRLETERTHPVSDSSAAPGAEEDGDVGTAASGAGLGGNKGTGTRNKDNFS